jgi:hypothetical protein
MLLTTEATNSLRAVSHRLSAANGGTRVTLSDTLTLLCRIAEHDMRDGRDLLREFARTSTDPIARYPGVTRINPTGPDTRTDTDTDPA